ncbi:MAG: hypothetical protein WBC82_10045 [Dehalococcoidia bacterium]
MARKVLQFSKAILDIRGFADLIRELLAPALGGASFVTFLLSCLTSFISSLSVVEQVALGLGIFILLILILVSIRRFKRVRRLDRARQTTGTEPVVTAREVLQEMNNRLRHIVEDVAPWKFRIGRWLKAKRRIGEDTRMSILGDLIELFIAPSQGNQSTVENIANQVERSVAKQAKLRRRKGKLTNQMIFRRLSSNMASVLDGHNIGLAKYKARDRRYEELETQLRSQLAREPSISNAAYDYLAYSYGINSLLLALIYFPDIYKTLPAEWRADIEPEQFKSEMQEYLNDALARVKVDMKYT